ncbi:MAG TPA: tRNA threonylcarbamoyladenosine dehydratase [Burkholderiaceae bacterium]|nr:tRNA threonylcarbamoyladenosine dehydratase [Burkholderiaceae bacterium]
MSGNSSPEDIERRFGAVARLYGPASLARFGAARIAVVGLGGVGTWAAEALARCGVGRLTLIDLDHIAPSNTNRQIHALEPNFGKAKVQAMADRIRAIHPAADLRTVEDFLTAENVAQCLQGIDLVIDCIDQVAAKAALIAYARNNGIAAVTCGGAGGRTDPARIRRDDLARTRGDRLLARLRHCLRRQYGYCGPGRGKQAPRFGIPAIFSDEPLTQPAAMCEPLDGPPGSPLACGGYGSSVTVTATMGLAAAAWALEQFRAP